MLAAFQEAVRSQRKPFVVQVGAGDGVTNCPVRDLILDRKLDGLLIDAQSDLLAECKSNYRRAGHYGLLYSNMAVASRNTSLHFKRLPVRLQGQYPRWVRGLATASGNTLSELARTRLLERGDTLPQPLPAEFDYMAAQAYPLRLVIASFAVRSVDVLVIDVTGMERDALASFDFNQYKPSVILISYRDLAPQTRSAVCNYMHKWGYAVSDCGGDWLLQRRADSYVPPPDGSDEDTEDESLA
jgi:hypothetical protein